MPFLQQGNSAVVTVPAGQSIAIGAPQDAAANVLIPVGLPGGPSAVVRNTTQTFGPYPNGATITVVCSRGEIEYDSGTNPVVGSGGTLTPAAADSLQAIGPANEITNAALSTLLAASGIVVGRLYRTPLGVFIGKTTSDVSPINGSLLLSQVTDIAGSRTITGTTTETSLYTLTIPARLMGTFGAIQVRCQGSMTNNANVKTLRIKFGNSSPMVLSATPASVATIGAEALIQNMGATDRQEAHPSLITVFGLPTTAVVTGAFDTTVDQLLEITAQLAVGTDSFKLGRVSVALVKP